MRSPILQAITDALVNQETLPPELRIRDLVAQCLPDSVCERRVSFDPPITVAGVPDEQDQRELTAKGMWSKYPRDPCRRRARLDILWRSADGPVAIELKSVGIRKSDTYGYDYLKDLHRLERLQSVAGCDWPILSRYAVFVTSVPDYWDAEILREPKALRIYNGLRTPGQFWVQYEQPSVLTRWINYPPFMLANPYQFQWIDIGLGRRVLITEVFAQGRISNR